MNKINESENLYKTGLNCKQIAKILEVSPTTIERYLKKLGIKLEKYSRRRYVNKNINVDFFKDLTKEEVIYYLGFIYADGNVYKPKNKNSSWKLTIELQKRDKEILENFNIRNKINENIKKNSVYMCVNSNEICDDLMKLGIVAKKSLKCKFPKNIPDNMIKHFIRGYFDGDGGFSINSRNTLVAYVCGTKEFLNEFKIKIPCISTMRKIGKEESNSYELRISTKKEEMGKFVEYLYKDSHFFLNRKREKALQYYTT